MIPPAAPIGLIGGLIILIILAALWARTKHDPGPKGPITWAEKKQIDGLADDYYAIMEAGYLTRPDLQVPPDLWHLYYLYREQLPKVAQHFHTPEGQRRAAVWRACAIHAGFDPELAGGMSYNYYAEPFDLGWQTYASYYETYAPEAP